jgi:hypothetical protein
MHHRQPQNSAAAKTPVTEIKSRLSVNSKTSPAWTHALGSQPALSLQPKLTVNQPGDEYEQEADQVAAQVMRTPVTPQISHQTDMLQRDDDKDKDSKTFSFDFHLLPPQIQLRLGGLMLQANTSGTEFQFASSLVKYRLGYAYGSDLYLGSQSGSYNSRLGFNPSTSSLSLGLSQDQFRFNASVNPTSRTVGFGLGYGAPLLPMPGDALNKQVNPGGAAAPNILGGLGGGFDPINFYKSQKDNIGSVMSAVKAVQPLADSKNAQFGAGLNFTYNPETGVMVYGGLQWFF